MPPLKITTQGHELPLQVEITDLTLEEVHRSTIPADGVWELTLQNQTYLLMAHYPSGHTHQMLLDLSSNETLGPSVVELPLEGAPVERGLTWAAQTRPELLTQRRIKPYQMRSMWARLWCFDGGWKLQSWQHQRPIRQKRLTQYQLHVDKEHPRVFLQLGGPKMAWRLLSLPPGTSSLLLTPKNQPLQEAMPIEFAIGFAHPSFNALVAALSRGAADTLIELKKTLRGQLDELLESSPQGPALVALFCYTLLKLGDDEALSNWPQRLTEKAPWLPDGLILQAWQRLYRKEITTETFGKLLLQARDLGTPLFTEGMRLLRDGFTTLQGEPSEADPAQEQWDATYAALDTNAVTTTFLGRSPEQPGVIAKGHPESPDHVVFIDDLTPQDLQWKGLLPPVATLELNDEREATDNVRMTIERGDFLVSPDFVSDDFDGHLPQTRAVFSSLESMTPSSEEGTGNANPHAFRSLTTATAAVKGWRRIKTPTPPERQEQQREVWQSWKDPQSSQSLKELMQIARGEWPEEENHSDSISIHDEEQDV